MISVLTLTYRRHRILEEAIESYLRQDFSGESEMVIINDCETVRYEYFHPCIKIINLDKRFSSLGKKLEYGFFQCKYDYIYRLDDDDLLTPWALSDVSDDIEKNPGYDIYRNKESYFFEHNVNKGIKRNVNSGNVFKKDYLSGIDFPDMSFGEDRVLLWDNNAKIYTSHNERKTMIYRWGMQTYHISGLGDISAEKSNEIVENMTSSISKNEEDGVIRLSPHFENNYYSQL